MTSHQQVNLQVVKEVALALDDLNEQVVFVGGAVVSLYADDPGAEEARPTKDIDISVQVSSYTEMEQLREQLAVKGIYPASGEKVLYRYHLKDILIDLIPIKTTALGPANRWLTKGFQHCKKVQLEKIWINILPVEYFLASKWEAHNNRGGDKRTSHDYEDIIYVLDNNLQVVEALQQSDDVVKPFIIANCKELIHDPFKDEIITAHLDPHTAAERKDLLIEKLRKITSQ